MMHGRVFGALLGALMISGCATLQRQAFAPPVVTVNDVRLAGIGVNGGRLDIEISMYNPNNFRLDAEALHYEVFIDTLRVGAGAIDQRITLLKKDSARVRIPVTFGLREVAAAGNALSERGSVPFQLNGDLRVLTPFGPVRRAFVQRGTYDGLNVSLMRR